jgi:hypothetical protein
MIRFNLLNIIYFYNCRMMINDKLNRPNYQDEEALGSYISFQ